ncbi:MAG: YbaB/EbfC family nucleoid-associated protein [Gammaproteobacteria bacterium]|nr:YbaB/EbfC family nucleoid-associated protein [Gammaproteobacteria bacterium]
MTLDPTNPNQENTQDITDKSAEIQNKMSDAQKKLALIEVEGKAGTEDYGIKVYLNGRYEATKVTIDPSVLEQPTQVVCDLMASAITDASRKAEIAIQNEMMKLFQNFDLTGK